MVNQAPDARATELLSWQSSAQAFLVIVVIGLTFPRDAHAYLDPGTGSIIIQGLIASAAAGLMIVRTYWSRLKSFYKKTPEAKSSEKGVEDDPERSGNG